MVLAKCASDRLVERFDLSQRGWRAVKGETPVDRMRDLSGGEGLVERERSLKTLEKIPGGSQRRWWSALCFCCELINRALERGRELTKKWVSPAWTDGAFSLNRVSISVSCSAGREEIKINGAASAEGLEESY